VTDVDRSTWLTKQQAADAIGVSTKTVEKLAQDRQLEQATWRPQGRGASRVVYQPDDVARIASARHPEAPPFVLPAVSNGNGHHPGPLAITTPLQSGEDAARALASGLTAIAAALQGLTSQSLASSESSQKSETLFLTIREAAAVTGLTQAYLRRACEDGTLKAIRDRGWRIRRKDLEQL
jgi:excisionase family DNA binding protein